MYKDNCFTKIINGQLPSKVVFEDENFLCFEDINPEATFHALIVPKAKYESIQDFTECGNDELIAGFLRTACLIAKNAGISESGYRLVMNCGNDGGQTVGHLHCHILGGEKLSCSLNNADKS